MRDAPESALPANVDGAIVSVGTFDGVHRGHCDLLQRLVTHADRSGVSSVVVTFRPHPLDVVNPAAAPLLLTAGEEQLDQLVDTGVNYVVVLPFTPALASHTAEQFVRDILVRRYRVRELWIGPDHGLGRGRAGDLTLLRGLGAKLGFGVEVVGAVAGSDGSPISSTSIRRAIAYGELERAADALGRRYGFRGRVVPGDQRGRELGYPTLNIALPSSRKLLPPEGVYAVRAQTRLGHYGGMMNLGPRPTFGGHQLGLEVHLFDASGDWYGLDVAIEFVARLRDVVKFANPAALVEQLARDADAARRALTEVQKPLTLNGST